jgi:3D (Asp-Asp-Asp) domain-containing protein
MLRAMSRMRPLTVLLIALLALATAPGCASRPKPPRGVQPTARDVTTTGYCPCKKCCNWKRNWIGRPVVASGPGKGQRKQVGVTASGTKARPGTIAADTRLFPFGTVIHVPGYGYGRVEDRGSAVNGDHLDLFFKSHRDALEWGRRPARVTIWRP